MFDQTEILALFNRGQFDHAIRLLEAHPSRATDSRIELHLGLAYKLKGNLPSAIEAFSRALAVEPYNFMAMLSKGSALELMGSMQDAAACYRSALQMAPAIQGDHGVAAKQIAHARHLVERFDRDRYQTLMDRTRKQASILRPEPRDRFDEAIALFTGQVKPQLQQPLLFHYPGLPAVPFWQRDRFTWIGDLESYTDLFRDEFLRLLAMGAANPQPYIARPAGSPLNQWEQLNYSPDWSAVHLWRDGIRSENLLPLLKNSFDALDRLPLAQQEGFAPTAMFSILAPQTKIPPHTGSTNVRQIVHLPLVVPPGCTFRVGNQTREWRAGSAWVFDDTIEHEASNPTDEGRTILIFDVWHPLLEEPERAAITALLSASRRLEQSR